MLIMALNVQENAVFHAWIFKILPTVGGGIYRGRRETPLPHPPPAWLLRSFALSPPR